jgi:hypothetical protein
MRRLVLVLWLAASAAVAQQPAKTTADSAPAESMPPLPQPPQPPPPTPEQDRYLQGLRTAGRGIAQLKSAVYAVGNAGRDTARLRQAGRRLGGLCGAARGFLTGGRGRMDATAYADSTRLKARRLNAQIDTLIRFVPVCESTAATQPDSTRARVEARIRTYEAALRDFRAAIGLPNR